MKIKEFDEKVRIGTRIVYKGRAFTVADINRRSHEAVFGRNMPWTRCSEFEMRPGGARAKKGRPPRPVTAIFKDGRMKAFRSSAEASEALGLSIGRIRNALRGEASVKGIRFTH